MAFATGARLGPYEIVAALGAGGMGEVYRARDTRLDRTVAIKVLPAELSADPERRARFEREARTIAALNHPHICTLHDIGQHDGTTYLVMEHLVGETLAGRLRRGALPVAHALEIGAQIAEALDAAHTHGVVHRDLKPGNVMLTRTGAERSGVASVKLLDFGLAKLRETPPRAPVLPSAPTMNVPLTQAGEVLGTRPYMAPEQVEGKATDERTDLWALGCVLYEMVTGLPAFTGDSVASITAAILTQDPEPLTARQPLTPAALEHVVRRCLSKAPEARWQSAHDVADELQWIAQSSGVTTLTGVQAPRGRRGLKTALGGAGVILAAAIVGAGAMWLLRPPIGSPAPVLRVNLTVSPADDLHAGGDGLPPTPGGSRTAFAWTPDGQALVFVGRRLGVQQLYVRRLDAAQARPLAGTEGAQVPAVSHDGQWVAFWARGAIKKVPVDGGPVVDLLNRVVVPPVGMTWDADGGVFFGRSDARIWQIAPAGAPTAVTTLGDGEQSHSLPKLLPGGQVLLYTVRKRTWSWGDEEIVAQTLPTGSRKVLVRDGADARYVPTGHLVFLRRGILFAVPFDAEHVEVHGTPVAVVDPVVQALTGGNSYDVTGAGQFAISGAGTLAWLPGPVVPYPDRALVTVDRRGRVAPLPAPLRGYAPGPAVSPDGRRLAMTIPTLTEVGLWLYDLDRGTLSPLTRDGEVNWTIWAPGGQRLLFEWVNSGRNSLAAQAADAAPPPEILAVNLGIVSPSSITPDGRELALVGWGLETQYDVLVATLGQSEVRVQPWLQTPDVEGWPAFSPDGQWLAYASDVSGRSEVYVRRRSGSESACQVSLEGGDSPAWDPSGRELFFGRRPDGAGKSRMMVAAFEAGSPPRVGTPRVLFEFDRRDLNFLCTPVRCYQVAPDGQRFYVTQAQASPSPPVVTQINLIQNWLEELKAKVPSSTR